MLSVSSMAVRVLLEHGRTLRQEMRYGIHTSNIRHTQPSMAHHIHLFHVLLFRDASVSVVTGIQYKSYTGQQSNYNALLLLVFQLPQKYDAF
jgi:hypothetical protein